MQAEHCALSFRLGEKTPGVVRRCFQALSYRWMLQLQFISIVTFWKIICNGLILCIFWYCHYENVSSNSCREAHEEDDEHWNIYWRVGNFKTGDWERCLPHQRINHLPKAWWRMYFLMFVAVCILNSFPGISLQKTALSDLWESCLPVMDQCAQLQQSSWIFLWPDTAYPAFPVIFLTQHWFRYCFSPVSWILPSEYTKFMRDFYLEREKDESCLFIAKPADLSRGRSVCWYSFAWVSFQPHLGVFIW